MFVISVYMSNSANSNVVKIVAMNVSLVPEKAIAKKRIKSA